MKRVRLRYVRRIKDRYGNFRYYLRKPGSEHIRLPDITDDNFFKAYSEAMGQKAKENLSYKPRTLQWLIEDWQKSERFKSLAPSTQATYRNFLLQMQTEDYAQHLVSDFKPVHIRSFMKRRIDTPSAANRLQNFFNILFDYAIELDWIEISPSANIKGYKERKKGHRAWTEQDIKQYEKFWPEGTMQRRALMLLLYTGQRRSDVVRMGANDLRGDLLHVIQKKTKTELYIPIHPALQKEIDLAPVAETFLQTTYHKPFTANGFYMRFKKWCAKAGLEEDLAPHGLRKAAARRLAESGCTVHQIASITGHASLAEVQLYTRSVDQERLAREALAMMQKVKHIGG